MELTPVKIPGIAKLTSVWSLNLFSPHAHDLGRRCLFQGRMHKVSGHFSKTWEERYFCLMPGSLLFYFDSPEDSTPKGIVVMNRDSVVESTELMGQRHALVLKPNPTDPASRHIQLACDTEDEAREWTEALFKAAQGAWLQEQSERSAREAEERQGTAATRLVAVQHLLRDAEEALRLRDEEGRAATARICSLEGRLSSLSEAAADVAATLLGGAGGGPVAGLDAVARGLLGGLQVRPGKAGRGCEGAAGRPAGETREGWTRLRGGWLLGGLQVRRRVEGAGVRVMSFKACALPPVAPP